VSVADLRDICDALNGEKREYRLTRKDEKQVAIHYKDQDPKTVQGLLRHVNVSTTLGLYAQSVNSSMVEAQESMLTAILRNGSNAVNSRLQVTFYR